MNLIKNIQSKLSFLTITIRSQDDDANIFPDDHQYQDLVRKAERGILQGVYPSRIAQGSSGSYFVKDEHKVCLSYKLHLCLFRTIVICQKFYFKDN